METTTGPVSNGSSIAERYQDNIKAMASREVRDAVVETCIAQGLKISRLTYVKWMVAHGDLHD